MSWKVIVGAALLVLVLMAGTAQAQQYPPESTTTIRVLPTSVVQQTTVVPTTPRRPPTNGSVGQAQVGGRLARTGSGNVAAAVRVGVLLLLVGFVVYLAGRRRRAVRARS